MDAPHLLHLGFLLLALAAPCPSIAMPSKDPAEGTQDSSSGKTTVTVYLCKDCDSSICQAESLSFETFEKIAETQNKMFSNEKIALVTRETHITMCFQQINYFPEGICGIFWEKAEGAGFSCGTLNSGENERSNITTEEKNICCKAETDIWKDNRALKCYTQKSHPEHTTLPPDIPGKPEFLTSKKSTIGTLLAFLFVGVCTGWATMYYFLRLRRGQAYRQDIRAPDKENLTHLR